MDDGARRLMPEEGALDVVIVTGVHATYETVI